METIKQLCAITLYQRHFILHINVAGDKGGCYVNIKLQFTRNM
jgi:hypothetical protein